MELVCHIGGSTFLYYCEGEAPNSFDLVYKYLDKHSLYITPQYSFNLGDFKGVEDVLSSIESVCKPLNSVTLTPSNIVSYSKIIKLVEGRLYISKEVVAGIEYVVLLNLTTSGVLYPHRLKPLEFNRLLNVIKGHQQV